MTWNWKWDSLTLKPKLLIMHPTGKKKGNLWKKTRSGHKSKEHTNAPQGRESRKRTQEFSYTIIFLHLLLQTSGLHVAGEWFPSLLPPLAEWKGHSPTMTNTQDRNILQKASDENLLFNLTHCAGKMLQMDHLQAWRGEKGFEPWGIVTQKGTVDRKIKGHCAVQLLSS